MENRRDTAKAERRSRIIKAARDLIRETGDAGLSMRALAAKAGVSLATPYNLFGSKRAVLVAVLEDIKGFGTRFASFKSLDPLERILRAARLAVSYYEDDPAFYRALWTSILAASASEERSAIFNQKRDGFWMKLLDDAVDEGLLLPDIDTAVLLRNLDYTFRSVMLHWVIAEIEIEDIQPRGRLRLRTRLARRGDAEGTAADAQAPEGFQAQCRRPAHKAAGRLADAETTA